MRTLLWITFSLVICCSALRSQISDRDSRQRMKQLNDLSKWSDAQNGKSQNRIPLAGGPDDDPTLAADVFHHEVSPAARKLAARAEHLSQKQQYEGSHSTLQPSLVHNLNMDAVRGPMSA